MVKIRWGQASVSLDVITGVEEGRMVLLPRVRLFSEFRSDPLRKITWMF